MRKITLLPVLFLLLLAACQPESTIAPTPEPVSLLATAEPTASTIQLTATPLPSNTPTSQPTATATLEPTITATLVPTATPIPPVDLYPGMVFLQDGIYVRVDNDRELQTIFQHPDAHILSFSPDGRFLAYIERESGDVYLREIAPGTDTKLLSGPLPAVQLENWWTAESEWALWSVSPTFEYVNAWFGGGLPLLLRLAGEGQVDLVAEPDPSRQLGTSPAASSGGGQIAFDLQGEGFLYSFDEGIRPFEPTDFGLTLVGSTEQSLRNPVFSPNGRFLAWQIKDYQLWPGYAPDQWEFGMALFDLEAGTATTIPNFILSAADHGYTMPMRWLDNDHLLLRGLIMEDGNPDTLMVGNRWNYRAALVHWPSGEVIMLAGTDLVQPLGGEAYLTVRELTGDDGRATDKEILIENLAESTVETLGTVKVSERIIRGPDGRIILIGNQLFDAESRTLRRLNLPRGLELVTWTAVN